MNLHIFQFFTYDNTRIKHLALVPICNRQNRYANHKQNANSAFKR